MRKSKADAKYCRLGPRLAIVRTRQTAQNAGGARGRRDKGVARSMGFLVVDCGTSGCRASRVSEDGTILSQSREPLSVETPRPMQAEVDTDRLWGTVREVIRRELAKCPGFPIDAVGVSAILGYVFLDGKGRPRRPRWSANSGNTIPICTRRGASQVMGTWKSGERRLDPFVDTSAHRSRSSTLG